MDVSNLELTTWPRMAAIAERLWSPKHINDTNKARPRYAYFRCLLNERGIGAAPSNNLIARSPPVGPGSCYTPNITKSNDPTMNPSYSPITKQNPTINPSEGNSSRSEPLIAKIILPIISGLLICILLGLYCRKRFNFTSIINRKKACKETELNMLFDENEFESKIMT